MTSKKTLVALQFDYENKSLEENFKTLTRLLKNCPEGSIILAPELCLSGYDYAHLERSSMFSESIIDTLCQLSYKKTFGLTLIRQKEDKYLNVFMLFSNGKIIDSRPKARLFPLGDEEKYFYSGTDEDIRIIEINGIKIATLVCFELRFTELWQHILGADIILVPSFWGKLRKEHLKTLSNALAIINQAYVIVANSSDDSMASSSGIISPFGDVYRDNSSYIIKREVDLNEIKKMRKYINIGL
ncbi:carbon-nitrogen hydrolase family protein [Sulfurospirillum arcachonense]|uniref:carbon-nitrogen hydrolase family protein n=1 Tax=Sulfurospirillum arcachonense TaxID=57666 RepID=UPI00046B05CF|nr:carbon-nitrogen hydrolase family protein [Sulfurospirillum arcachonense]